MLTKAVIHPITRLILVKTIMHAQAVVKMRVLVV